MREIEIVLRASALILSVRPAITLDIWFVLELLFCRLPHLPLSTTMSSEDLHVASCGGCRLTADPAIGVGDIQKAIEDFLDAAGSRQLPRLLEHPKGTGWN